MREYVLSIGGKEYKTAVKELNTETASVIVNGKEYEVELKELGAPQKISAPRRPVQRPTAAAAAPAPTTDTGSNTRGLAGSVTAPLPGLVLELLVREGDEVKAGQDLMVMEAMKMENKIQSPHDGVVKRIFVQQGANVAEGDKLFEVSRPAMTTI